MRVGMRTRNLRWVVVGIWVILLGAGIFFLGNSYLNEVKLIYNSAKLHLLETSFGFHPKLMDFATEDQEILYLYLLNADGTIADSFVRQKKWALAEVRFPGDELIFQRRQVQGEEILQLEKMLRRGRESGEQQGLIIGMNYEPYRAHEYRSFGKYLFLLLSLLGLFGLAALSWQKWLKAQAEMAQNERFIYTGKLSRQIAHEIKNPLGVMQATVDFVMELDDPEMMKGELQDISDEIQRLNRLVEKIRLFARNEAPAVQEIRVGEFLQEFLAKVDHHYPGVIGSFDEEVRGEIRGDRDQLTQVLLNLVQNAVESYPENLPARERKVLIGLRSGWQQVEIFVQDWGRPIAPEIKDQIFDPYITNKAHGSGLGLAICRQMVQSHGGRLELWIDEDVKRFVICIPFMSREGDV